MTQLNPTFRDSLKFPGKLEADIQIGTQRGRYILSRFSLEQIQRDPAAKREAIKEVARRFQKKGTAKPQKSGALPALTYGDFFEREFLPSRKSINTKKTYGSHFRNHLKEKIGDIELSTLSGKGGKSIILQKVRSYLDSAKLENSSRDLILNVLLSSLSFAYENGHITQIPKLDYFGTTKTAGKINAEKYFNPEETEKLLEAALSMSLDRYVFCLLGVDGGLRVGEISGLTWKKIDMVNQRITIDTQHQLNEKGAVIVLHPKGNKDRVINMTNRLTIALEKLRGEDKPFQVVLKGSIRREIKKGEEDWITSPDQLKSRFKTIAKRAGLEGHVHMMRHTSGTVIGETNSLKAVSEHLGHSSITTAQIYVNGDQEEKIRKALNSAGRDHLHRAPVILLKSVSSENKAASGT